MFTNFQVISYVTSNTQTLVLDSQEFVKLWFPPNSLDEQATDMLEMSFSITNGKLR